MSELLDCAQSALVVIDVQEKLFSAVFERERMLSRIHLLLAAARELEIPVIVTEQYPRGLGGTMDEILKQLPDAEPVEKTWFSCVPNPGFVERLYSLGRHQILLAGMETHICVLQTAFDLAAARERVFVAADATSSRRRLDYHIGLERMRRNGITVTTVESVVFEWLHRSDSAAFKRLQHLIRHLGSDEPGDNAPLQPPVAAPRGGGNG